MLKEGFNPVDSYTFSLMSKQSTFQVNVHPLVLINISDHYTRVKVKRLSAQKEVPRVFGVLFGVQNGLVVDIFESTEMVYNIDESTGKVNFDGDFLEKKKDLMTQIFPSFEILGWYATGSEISKGDLITHKAFGEFNENPLYLLIKPDELSQDEEALPISLFETRTQMNTEDGSANMIFVNVDFKIDAIEPERICVDHIAQQTPSGNEPAIVPHLKSLRSAVGTLVSRVETLRNFLSATQQGKIEKHHALIRQAISLCNQLPLLESEALSGELLKEANDTMLVSYLSSITNCSGRLHEVMGKYSEAYTDQHLRNLP